MTTPAGRLALQENEMATKKAGTMRDAYKASGDHKPRRVNEKARQDAAEKRMKAIKSRIGSLYQPPSV